MEIIMNMLKKLLLTFMTITCIATNAAAMDGGGGGGSGSGAGSGEYLGRRILPSGPAGTGGAGAGSYATASVAEGRARAKAGSRVTGKKRKERADELNLSTQRFVESVASGDIAQAQATLESCSDVNINVRLEDGMTPLHIAAVQGDDAMTTLLLEQRDVEINPTTAGNDPTIPYGLTPYDMATHEGHLDVVMTLINDARFDLGVTVTGQLNDVEHVQPRPAKRRRKKWHIADYAIPNPNAHCLEKQLFSIISSENNREKKNALKSLQELGVDVNARTNICFPTESLSLTPLHRACIVGDYMVAKFLLQHTMIEINARSNDSQADVHDHDTRLTALHYASKHGHCNIIALLLRDRRCKTVLRTKKKRLTAFQIRNVYKTTEIKKIFDDSLRPYVKPKQVTIQPSQSRTPRPMPARRPAPAPASGGGRSGLASRMQRRATGSAGGQLRTRTHACKICNKKFISKNNVRSHIWKCHDQREFKCKHCNKTILGKSACSVHEKQCSSTKTFQCNMCPFETKIEYNYKRHKRSAHAPPKFGCATCSKRFKENYNLKEHVKRQHSRNLLYPCTICSAPKKNVAFDEKRLLDEHNIKAKH